MLENVPAIASAIAACASAIAAGVSAYVALNAHVARPDIGYVAKPLLLTDPDLKCLEKGERVPLSLQGSVACLL